jgi:hypothetical protein
MNVLRENQKLKRNNAKLQLKLEEKEEEGKVPSVLRTEYEV